MAFAVPVRSLAQQKPQGGGAQGTGPTSSFLAPPSASRSFKQKAHSAVHDLAGKAAGWLPAELWQPYVSLELTIKLPMPMPPPYDASGGPAEPLAALQAVVRGCITYQLEPDITANSVSSGKRRFAGDLEALISSGYREWTCAVTELCEAVASSPETHPYFLAVSRQQHDAVFYFAKEGCTITAADAVLSQARSLCAASRLPCCRNGKASLTIPCEGYGAALGLSVLLDSVDAQLSAKLPLILCPAPFTGAVCRRPTVRTYSEETSMFVAASHYVKLTGCRVLPDTLAKLFTACRSLGAQCEMDITPSAASLVSSCAQPVPTAWSGERDERKGRVPRLPSSDAPANTSGSDDEEMSDASSSSDEQEAGEGGGPGGAAAGGGRFCPKRVVISAKQVMVSGVPAKLPG